MIKKICLILVGCLFCSSVALAYKQADLDKLFATKDCGGCDLSSAPLANKDLNKANLQGADLQGADLHNASLRMAELAGADLRKADLSMTIFEAADLSKVDLRGAKTVGAVFDGAYLADTKIDDKSKISDKTLKQEAAVSAHKDAVGAVVQPQSNAEKKLPVLSRKELLEKALDDEKCIE